VIPIRLSASALNNAGSAGARKAPVTNASVDLCPESHG